jgi:negative regulator of flagellin synthesis FlgM
MNAGAMSQSFLDCAGACGSFFASSIKRLKFPSVWPKTWQASKHLEVLIMVIDFSRLNSTPPATGSTRPSVTKETGTAADASSVPAKTAAASASSGEAVHLSDEAQRLQTISDKVRSQPVVNSARVAELKQAVADGSYKVDSGRVASKLLNFEAQR